MVGQLLRKHPLFVHPATPIQMKGSRFFVLVLDPSSVYEYSFQPKILRVEDKDLIDCLNVQPSPILGYQIIESLAFPIDDEVHVCASLLVPLFPLTSYLDLVGHLAFILN